MHRQRVWAGTAIGSFFFFLQSGLIHVMHALSHDWVSKVCPNHPLKRGQIR